MNLTIQTKAGLYDVECDEGENLLYAALRQGLDLPYECATGTCGTCRCRVMDGDTELCWTEAPGLSYVRRDKNETLMCQAVVRSNCTIRVPGEVTQGNGRAEFFEGRLTDLKKLTHDVVSFSVFLDQPMSFKAGQFVVLETSAVKGARAYSMTNFGSDVRQLDFVVKRKPGGGFCDWLFDGAPDGAEMRVFGPLGRATFDPSEDKNVLCIAGGSGVAGMMAILEHGVASGHFSNHTGHLFFGVRTAADVFFADTFSRLVDACSGTVNVTIALSDEDPDDALKARYPSLSFAHGFVHAVTSEQMKDRYDNMIGYVAGPPPMVDGSLRMLVLEARLPGADIRYDKFS